jgi:hypothetical protein
VDADDAAGGADGWLEVAGWRVSVSSNMLYCSPDLMIAGRCPVGHPPDANRTEIKGVSGDEAKGIKIL